MPSYSCKYGHSYEPKDAKSKNWICPIDKEPLQSDQQSALVIVEADCGCDEPAATAADLHARSTKRHR